MNRTRLNFIVDAVTLVGFVFLVGTGFLLRWSLPPGSGGLHSHAGGTVKSVWGLTRHEWGDIHFWISVTVLVLLAFHVVLHWRWIVAVTRGKKSEGSGMRLLTGALASAALLVVAVAPIMTGVEVSEGSGRERPDVTDHETAKSGSGNEVEPEGGQHHIRGNWTLRQIEDDTGVPVAYLANKLNLPASVNPDERLGRLRRAFGFELHDVRQVVADWPGKEE